MTLVGTRWLQGILRCRRRSNKSSSGRGAPRGLVRYHCAWVLLWCCHPRLAGAGGVDRLPTAVRWLTARFPWPWLEHGGCRILRCRRRSNKSSSSSSSAAPAPRSRAARCLSVATAQAPRRSHESAAGLRACVNLHCACARVYCCLLACALSPPLLSCLVCHMHHRTGRKWAPPPGVFAAG